MKAHILHIYTKIIRNETNSKSKYTAQTTIKHVERCLGRVS